MNKFTFHTQISKHLQQTHLLGNWILDVYFFLLYSIPLLTAPEIENLKHQKTSKGRPSWPQAWPKSQIQPCNSNLVLVNAALCLPVCFQNLQVSEGAGLAEQSHKRQLIYSQTSHTPFTSGTWHPLSAGHHVKTKTVSKQNGGDRCNYYSTVNTRSKIIWSYKMQCKFIFSFF